MKNKTNTGAFLGAVMALLIAYAMRNYPFPQQTLLLSFTMALRYIIHASLLLAWCFSLSRRLVNQKLRRLLLSVGALMAFWLTVRTIKFEFVADPTEPVVRYLWYCFYIPMVLIPMLGVFVINYLGKPENYSHPRWMNWLFGLADALIVTVFTNDLHQQVFFFHKGIELFDSHYEYRFIYFILMAWYILLGLYFVGMLLKKSRIPGSRGVQLLPLFIMLAASVFWILYSLRLINCDLTVIDCLLVASLLESAIQIGMLPSNTKHAQLFAATTIPVQIVDEAFCPRYVSDGATPLRECELRETLNGAVHMDNALLRSVPITAGRVVWMDDISEVNALHQQLQDIRLQLHEETTLLQAEIELKERKSEIDEQNRIYDRIVREVSPQLSHAEVLFSRIEGDPKLVRTLLPKVCVLGSYIKRRGNLLLLGEEHRRLQAAELEHCLRESLENLRLDGVFTMLNTCCEGTLTAECIVAVYDLYETLVERLWESMTAMLINLNCKNGGVSMNIQMGCTEEIAEAGLADITFPYGALSYEFMEEDVVIKLTIGGDTV